MRALRHTISEEGSPRASHIRTVPQQKGFDTQDLRRGVSFVRPTPARKRRRIKSREVKVQKKVSLCLLV